MLDRFIPATKCACCSCNTNFMKLGLDNKTLVEKQSPSYFVHERRVRFQLEWHLFNQRAFGSLTTYLLFKCETTLQVMMYRVIMVLCHIDVVGFPTNPPPIPPKRTGPIKLHLKKRQLSRILQQMS